MIVAHRLSTTPSAEQDQFNVTVLVIRNECLTSDVTRVHSDLQASCRSAPVLAGLVGGKPVTCICRSLLCMQPICRPGKPDMRWLHVCLGYLGIPGRDVCPFYAPCTCFDSVLCMHNVQSCHVQHYRSGMGSRNA